MKTLLFLFLLSSAGARAASFDEAALDKLKTEAKVKKENVIIYTWSPHMVLSQKGLTEVLQTKWKRPTKVVVLIDPNANMDLAKSMVSQNRWPASVLVPVSSPTLIKRGVRVHYPNYMFSKNGDLKPVVPGYKNPSQLNRLTEKFFR